MGRVKKHRQAKEKKTVGGPLAGLLLLVLLFGVGTQLYQMQSQLAGARAEADALADEIQQVTEENQELEEDIRNSSDPEKIEETAREELGMVVPGEKVFYHSGG